MNATRRSPLHAELEKLRPVWGNVGNMPVPARFEQESAALPVLLSDVSCLARAGLKGPQAAAWLGGLRVAVPEAINTWQVLPGEGLVARLGATEFLIEDGIHGQVVAGIKLTLRPGIAGVYPVLRQDAALVLTGERVNELLLETCSVNFLGFACDERRVIMTSMVGVSVTIVRWLRDGVPLYRIWCDGSFGPYLWATLLEVARDLGGGAVGVSTLFPEWNINKTEAT
jgi:sarcosine oxidase subunit gamma